MIQQNSLNEYTIPYAVSSTIGATGCLGIAVGIWFENKSIMALGTGIMGAAYILHNYTEIGSVSIFEIPAYLYNERPESRSSFNTAR